MNFEQAVSSVIPPCAKSMEEAQKRWNSIAKPLNSLGLLEKAIIQIAGITGTPNVEVDKRAVVIMCADNGVVCEGVTQTGSEVTAIVAENFTKGATSVNNMAKIAHADIIPVDIGMVNDVNAAGMRQCKIARGTKNLYRESAMTREQAIRAIETGIQLAGELKGQGYRILATGEMGIGNTTTSSAVASVLLNQPVELVTGKGAGLSSKGLERKIEVIKEAIRLHQPDPADPVDVLAKVGGFDIAGLTGVFLGGAAYHVPVVVDGFISAVSALLAVRICPQAAAYLLPSHVSKEPAGRMLLDALELKPFINCEMCLGEGTGAVALFPILDMAAEVYRNMSTFAEAAIEEYQPL